MLSYCKFCIFQNLQYDTYLAVQPEGDEHEEEERWPEGGGGEGGHRRGVHHKGQAGTWGRDRDINIIIFLYRSYIIVSNHGQNVRYSPCFVR